MPAKLSVHLNVSDLPRTLDFYKKLGFEEEYVAREGENAMYADLVLDEVELSLSHIPASDDPDFQEWVSTPLGAGVVVYIMTENVDRYHDLAKEAGAVIEVPPQTRFYGRVLTINDPDGYTITFLDESKGAK